MSTKRKPKPAASINAEASENMRQSLVKRLKKNYRRKKKSSDAEYKKAASFLYGKFELE